MKTILVTGANGLIGSEVVKKLNLLNKYNVIAASRNIKSKDYKNVLFVTNDELFENRVDLKKVYAVIQCAFSRSNECEQLALGLDFTNKIFKLYKKNNLNNIINISSQGVYRQPPVHRFLDESCEIGPKDSYGVAKLATEYFMEDIFADGENYTNVRLSSVNFKQRFTQYFVNQCIAEENINVLGAEQKISLIDPRDVADALIALVDSLPIKWKKVYNLGTGRVTTIGEMAKLIQNVAVEKFSFKPIKIKFKKKDLVEFSPVDIKTLNKDTGWKPIYNDESMIVKMFEETLSNS